MRRLTLLSALLLTACESLTGTDAPGDGTAAPKPAPGGDVIAVPKPGAQPEPGSTFGDEDCDKVEPGEPVPDGQCITARIRCGDEITGHTQGSGVARFDTKFYERFQCTPSTTNHDSGDERVYELLLPEGEHTADVYLETPCANLDLAAIKYGGEACPDLGSVVNQCEMWPKPRSKSEHVKLVSQGESRWLIVVEGQGDEEGPFQLRVECKDGLY